MLFALLFVFHSKHIQKEAGTIFPGKLGEGLAVWSPNCYHEETVFWLQLNGLKRVRNSHIPLSKNPAWVIWIVDIFRKYGETSLYYPTGQ